MSQPNNSREFALFYIEELEPFGANFWKLVWEVCSRDGVSLSPAALYTLMQNLVFQIKYKIQFST